MKAKDIMSKDVITVKPETKIRDLIKILNNHKVSGAPVVDKQGTLVGIVSEKDVIRAQLTTRYEIEQFQDIYDLFIPVYSEYEKDFPHTSSLLWVEQIMTRDVLSISPKTEVKVIADLMISKRYHRFPVVDKKNKIVGIVSTIDMLKAIK